jgi:hypothetical protein
MRPALFCLALLAPLAAEATLLVQLSDEDLVRRADAVVQGEVLEVESYRDAARDRVFTRVTVGVTDYLKGRGPDEIAVRIAGGVLDGLEYRVIGAPRFQVGEEVVLFVRTHGDTNSVIGMSQGKLAVVTDAAGERWLERDLGGVALVDAQGHTHHGSNGRLRLADLRALIDRLRPTVPADGGTVLPAPTTRP